MGSRYDTTENVPLFFIRMHAFVPVTGLTVKVSVVNAMTDALLLPQTSAFEQGGSGLYSYSWNHGIAVDTECVATYFVTDLLGTKEYKEFFSINAARNEIETNQGVSA